MKNLINKFKIFWAKFCACWQLLTKSKTNTWVVLFEELNKNGEYQMTYTIDMSADNGMIYSMLHAALIEAGGDVINYFKDKHPGIVKAVEKDLKASKECMDLYIKMTNTAKNN